MGFLEYLLFRNTVFFHKLLVNTQFNIILLIFFTLYIFKKLVIN